MNAVDDVSLEVFSGETVGLVGESGCGKSTTGLAALRLLNASGGRIVFDGVDLTHLDARLLRPLRRRMQMVFQDPYGSLNPRMRVRDIVGEPLMVHRLASTREDYRARVARILERVGLSREMAERFPHEFSGGQRQRVGIARALITQPQLIVCDEPVSALDVSVQAQVVNLLMDLQEELGLTYLFIAHDLAVVRHISHRIAVMYLGRIVELAPRDALYRTPLHPYTQLLLAAVPIPDPFIESRRKRAIVSGEVPSAINLPQGCRFQSRCPHVTDTCREREPGLEQVAPGRYVACHLQQGGGAGGA